VLGWARRERENLKEGLAMDAYTDKELNRIVGQCMTYKALFDLTAEQLMEEDK
jgi:hypothetical protein